MRPTDCAGFPSCRLVLMLMGFFAFFNCYTLRVNLSVAIVAMVNTSYLRELEASVDSASNLTTASDSADDVDVCGNIDDDVNDNETISSSNMTTHLQVNALVLIPFLLMRQIQWSFLPSFLPGFWIQWPPNRTKYEFVAELKDFLINYIPTVLEFTL